MELPQFGYVTDSNKTVIYQPQLDDEQKIEKNLADRGADSIEALVIPSTSSSNLPSKNVNNVIIKDKAHYIEQLIQPTSIIEKKDFVQPMFNLKKKTKDENAAPELPQFGYATDSNKTIIYQPQLDDEQKIEKNLAARGGDSIEALVISSTSSSNLPSKNVKNVITKDKAHYIEQLIQPASTIEKKDFVQPKFNLKKKTKVEDAAPAHVNDHINNRDDDFQCEVCNQTISGLHLFRIHKRKYQSQTKRWACEICSKKYSTKNLLVDHINTHTGNRPFECATCSKSFMSQKTLTQHERIHSGVKKFSCEQCHKKFRSAPELKSHSLVHTGLKAFKCNTCGKAFARNTELKDHERTHTGEKPYKCEICGSSFNQRSNLYTHKRTIHYNETRFKCQDCGKGYIRRRLLDHHIKTVHRGEKPFKCDLCDAKFRYSAGLKYHVRAPIRKDHRRVIRMRQLINRGGQSYQLQRPRLAISQRRKWSLKATNSTSLLTICKYTMIFCPKLSKKLPVTITIKNMDKSCT